MRTQRILLTAIFFAFLAASPILSAQATLTVINLDGPGEGLNDPEPRAPVGGNPGTTLGAQRLFVLQHAADLWGERLSSSVEIEVEVFFDPLDCDPQGALLGAFGPLSFHENWTVGTPPPFDDFFFCQAQANALAGIDLNPAEADMDGVFNSDIDEGCLGPGLVWYYGVDNNPPPGQLDLLTTALHELAHGLGFLSLVDPETGERFLDTDDIWNYFLYDIDFDLYWCEMFDDERADSAINGPNLVWAGPFVPDSCVTPEAGQYNAGVNQGFIQMYAPPQVIPGSSISHWDQVLDPDELMEPDENTALEIGLTINLMKDMGWPVAPPPTGGTLLLRGDCDGDGTFNGLPDGVFALNFQFSGGQTPVCLEACDPDNDGNFNGLVDGLFILLHQFSGGPPPTAPYPNCGEDPDDANSLGCDTNGCG